MLNETELKLRLSSKTELSRVLSWCEQEFGKPSRLEQRDEYYDTLTQDLRKQDLSLRVRRANGKILIAMKSPRVFLTETIHDRIELEFTAADENELAEAISRYGLKATAITEKKRWAFERDDFKILVDKLPFIGCFVEIEAPTVNRINEVVNNLGLSHNQGVNQNYSELLEERLKEIGLPIRPDLIATFEEESRWVSSLSVESQESQA